MFINSHLSTLILSITLSIPTTLIINHLVNPQPQFAVFDFNGTINSYNKDLTDQNIDKDTLMLKNRQFNFILSTVLSDYIRQNNVILLMEPAAIKGAPNVTNHLQRKISLAISRLPS